MFGYATDETEEKMPLTITLAHKLNRRMADARRSEELAWIRPDSKTQVEFKILNKNNYCYFILFRLGDDRVPEEREHVQATAGTYCCDFCPTLA